MERLARCCEAPIIPSTGSYRSYQCCTPVECSNVCCCIDYVDKAGVIGSCGSFHVQLFRDCDMPQSNHQRSRSRSPPQRGLGSDEENDTDMDGEPVLDDHDDDELDDPTLSIEQLK